MDQHTGHRLWNNGELNGVTVDIRESGPTQGTDRRPEGVILRDAIFKTEEKASVTICLKPTVVKVLR